MAQKSGHTDGIIIHNEIYQERVPREQSEARRRQTLHLLYLRPRQSHSSLCRKDRRPERQADASVENNQVVVVVVVKAHSHLLQPKLIEKCIALNQM